MNSLRLIFLPLITLCSAITMQADSLTSRHDAEMPTSMVSDSTQGADSACIVFLDYNSFETVADIIKPYSGRPVLIDLWSVFCQPCIKSFAHVKPLRDFAAENDIQLLYIALDDSETRVRRWKELVCANNLIGHHVITNPGVAKDVHNVFKRDGKVILPTYAFVDREGNVRLLNLTAKEISDPDRLRSEIEGDL